MEDKGDNMRTMIRLDKVYREIVPVTLLLDERQPFSLDSVPSKKISLNGRSDSGSASKETGKKREQTQEEEEEEQQEKEEERESQKIERSGQQDGC